MVSSFDVYMVMQLDSIREFFAIVGFFLAFASIAAFGVVFIEYNKASKSGIALLVLAAISGMAHSLLPSSKTAAAMVVVPALTSDQVVEPVTAEARELYALAKQALTNLSKVEPPKPAEPAKN